MQHHDLEREQVSAELAQLNEALRVSLEEYEAEAGSAFLYHGRTYAITPVRKKRMGSVTPRKTSPGVWK